MPEKRKIAISMLLTHGIIKSNIAFKIMKAVIIIIKSEFLLGFFKNKSILLIVKHTSKGYCFPKKLHFKKNIVLCGFLLSIIKNQKTKCKFFAQT